MKTATQNTTIQNFFSGIRMIVLFVLIVSSSFTMVGQNKNEVASKSETFQVVASDDTVAASQSNETTNTSMNFVSWFMGTKQTPNANQSGDAAVSQKKQIINSGIAPNRLLIKAFLKKASNYNTTIA
ncbi:hypothetical protein ACFQZF_06695 [Flavobacterium myungsuense]|uniref:Uncharacterized protein n=1 Tax=Flavobacterium myungsuense TaxID=651823 RepID=A0ABW3J2D5_9FLAO